MSYDPGDILYFKEYTFNDTGEVARHFGLVILPTELTDFESQIYCCVITSNAPRNTYAVHLLDHNDYPCFSKPTYARVHLQDYIPISGVDTGRKQPVGKLDLVDRKKVFKILRNVLFSQTNPVDKYLRATIIKEWKKTL